jgi:hypothetical protein
MHKPVQPIVGGNVSTGDNLIKLRLEEIYSMELLKQLL